MDAPFLIALRLLGRLGIGLPLVRAEVRLLRENVAPREAKLPIEDLCHLILKRELNVPKAARHRGTQRQEADGLARRKREQEGK